MSALPAAYALNIYQRTSPYVYVATWTAAGAAVDLTGYSAVFTCRPSTADPSITFQLSTQEGGIVLGGAAGTVTITFPILQPLTGAYDLILYDASGNEYPLLEGDFTLVQAVTR